MAAMYPTDFDSLQAGHGPSLLGPNDPAPFQVVNPGGGASVLLVCDHAGRTIPEAFGTLGLSEAEMARHVAYDIGAKEVTEALAARLDAIAVLATYSRLLIDLNRQLGDPASILEESDDVQVLGNQGISEEQMQARAETFFWPYHQAVGNGIAHLWRQSDIPPALFSIHTFTPSLKGQDRYWHIGVLWNRDPRMAVPLIHALREEPSLHVGDNEPYSGREIAYTIDLHAGAAGLPNAAVEIRQDLVESPTGVAEWADRLAAALGEILADRELHKVEHY